MSHNIGAVKSLCNTGILLLKGKVEAEGDISSVAHSYLATNTFGATFTRPSSASDRIYLSSAVADYLYQSNPYSVLIIIKMTVCSNINIAASIDVRIRDALGNPTGFATVGGFNPKMLVKLEPGGNDIVFSIQADLLARGNYIMSIDIAKPNVAYYDRVEDCLSIFVDAIPPMGSNRVLDQSWGFGSVQFVASIDGNCVR